MGRKNFKKKDKFGGLPEGFKEAVDSSSTDEIRKRISEVAILDVTMRQTLKNDPDVEDAKAKLKNLMEPYNEDFKSFKLQIQYCKGVLDDKGGGNVVGSAVNRLNQALEGIRNPDGKGETKVFIKPIGSTERIQIGGPKDE